MGFIDSIRSRLAKVIIIALILLRVDNKHWHHGDLPVLMALVVLKDKLIKIIQVRGFFN